MKPEVCFLDWKSAWHHKAHAEHGEPCDEYCRGLWRVESPHMVIWLPGWINEGKDAVCPLETLSGYEIIDSEEIEPEFEPIMPGTRREWLHELEAALTPIMETRWGSGRRYYWVREVARWIKAHRLPLERCKECNRFLRRHGDLRRIRGALYKVTPLARHHEEVESCRLAYDRRIARELRQKTRYEARKKRELECLRRLRQLQRKTRQQLRGPLSRDALLSLSEEYARLTKLRS